MYTTTLVETKPSNLVTKANSLIEASYKLGSVEQKIILCLASNISPKDNDFKTYTLPIKQFINLLGLKGNSKYTDLRKITKGMMQKVFEVRVENKVIQVAWLSFVAYNENEGTIDLRFDPFLRPFLLELKLNFTSYNLDNVIKLKSTYAIRIYELLKQYEKINERTFTLSDLRKMLGAEDIYPAYGNFKQRVLLPAQKELEKKTDIQFDVEEIKVGRKIEKVKFVIRPNKQMTSSKQLTLFKDNQLQDKPLFEIQAKKLAMKIGFNLSDKVLSKWREQGEQNVINCLEQIQGRKDIKNPIGYITELLKAAPKSPSNSDDEIILVHLISKYSRSKEIQPDWFLEKSIIDDLRKHFSMDENTSIEWFKKFKNDIFTTLEIKGNEKPSITEEEFLREKKALEKELLKYKKK